MSNAAARFGGGFLALAAIWIGVYWLWEPSRTAGVSFAEDPEAGQTADEPAPDPEPTPREVGPAPEQPPTQDPVADPPAGESDQPGEQAEAGGVIPPQFRDYTVQRGDTFERISRRFFETGRHAGAIARANPFVSPTGLREGQALRIPVDPENIQGVVPEGAEPDLPEPELIEYTVVRGDTLSEIAQHFYGSLRYADVIFNANRDTMSSPNDLQIGQVLRIPSRKSVLGEGE